MFAKRTLVCYANVARDFGTVKGPPRAASGPMPGRAACPRVTSPAGNLSAVPPEQVATDETARDDGAASPIIQSLVRGLSVIRAFDAEHSHMTLSEVARRADLSRATARRILHTLASLDYVDTDGRDFSLRPRILELGYTYLSSLDLPTIAAPHLKRLTVEVNESSSVAVLDGTDIVYVARVATRRIMTVAISVGTRFPAHLTSMGRVLIAGLDPATRAAHLDKLDLTPRTHHTITDRRQLEAELARIAEQGWALVDQELEEGLRSIAVPLHGESGRVVAAMNVSTSTRRGAPEVIRAEILPHLLATAAEIEADLASVYRAP